MKRVKLEHNVNLVEIRSKVLAKYKDDQFFLDIYKSYKNNGFNIELVDLIDLVENQRLCIECLEISMCKQKLIGHHLDYIDGSVDYSQCKYYSLKEKIKNYYSGLVYTTRDFKTYLPNSSSLDFTEQRAEIIEYIISLKEGNVKKGFYLYGPPGVGKTFILEILLDHYLANNIKCAYILLNDLSNELRSYYYSFDGDSKQLYYNTINKLKKVSVLFIDDIGSEKLDSFVRDELLFPILDHRMNNSLLTFFTSNYEKESLLEHYTKTTNTLEEPVKAKRLLERINVLSSNYVLIENKSRRL